MLSINFKIIVRRKQNSQKLERKLFLRKSEVLFYSYLFGRIAGQLVRTAHSEGGEADGVVEGSPALPSHLQTFKGTESWDYSFSFYFISTVNVFFVWSSSALFLSTYYRGGGGGGDNAFF